MEEYSCEELKEKIEQKERILEKLDEIKRPDGCRDREREICIDKLEKLKKEFRSRTKDR